MTKHMFSEKLIVAERQFYFHDWILMYVRNHWRNLYFCKEGRSMYDLANIQAVPDEHIDLLNNFNLN
jgi:hypothetical protein